MRLSRVDHGIGTSWFFRHAGVTHAIAKYNTQVTECSIFAESVEQALHVRVVTCLRCLWFLL